MSTSLQVCCLWLFSTNNTSLICRINLEKTHTSLCVPTFPGALISSDSDFVIAFAVIYYIKPQEINMSVSIRLCQADYKIQCVMQWSQPVVICGPSHIASHFLRGLRPTWYNRMYVFAQILILFTGISLRHFLCHMLTLSLNGASI